MIIGLLGKKQSGKDTSADYLNKKYNYNKCAFANLLKETCKVLFDLSDEQVYGELKEVIDQRWETTPRHILQFVGTDLIRNQISSLVPKMEKDFWIHSLLNKMQNDKKYVISDARFQNEVDMIKNKKGIIIKLIRNNINSGDLHISESGIDLIQNFDFVIENNGTIDDLYKKIDDIINTLENL